MGRGPPKPPKELLGLRDSERLFTIVGLMRTGDEKLRTSARLPPTAGAPGCESRRRQPAELLLGVAPPSLTTFGERELLKLRAGASGIPPLTMPARDSSPAPGRTKELRPTPARPKSAARKPVTAPLKRALRYTLAMLVLFTTARLRPAKPRPYQGRKRSKGASGTQPMLPYPKPRLTPKPGSPKPKKPTMAGDQ